MMYFYIEQNLESKDKEITALNERISELLQQNNDMKREFDTKIQLKDSIIDKLK